jgi:hypothetical protein
MKRCGRLEDQPKPMSRLISIVAALAAVAPHALAGPTLRVVDLQNGPRSGASSMPEGFARAGALTCFSASTVESPDAL